MADKKKLTLKERIHQAQGSQELEKKKAIHSWVHAVSYEREEFQRLWVQSDNATWGHNFGRMVGMQQIHYNHSHDEVERSLQESMRLATVFPEYVGGDVRSVGATGLHALSEGCVEMASDGGSGRGWFMTPGTMSTAVEGPNGQRGFVCLWEYYGCDFVYHDDQWLYIHEHVCPVFGTGLDDQNWGHDLYAKSDDDPAHNMRRPAPCEVTDKEVFSDRYDVHQVVQHLLWECPEPYETLDDAHSYSPGRNEV